VPTWTPCSSTEPSTRVATSGACCVPFMLWGTF